MKAIMGGSVAALTEPIPHVGSGKLKSVTFTGCWTCRFRKVKCDERQINGCGVCERARLDCAGYGVNLCWVTGQKQDLQGRRRRNIKFDQSNSPSMPEVEIAKILSNLDTISTPSNTVIMGPFAVFDAQTCNNIRPVNESLDHQPYDNLSPNSCEETSSVGTDDTTCDIGADGRPCWPEHPLQEDETSCTEFARSCASPLVQGLETCGEDNWIATLSQMASSGSESTVAQSFGPDFSPGRDPFLHLCNDGTSPVRLMRQSLASASCLFSSPYLELSIPLFQDSQTSMLMHHYVNHVADLLQPVLHPRNPWRTTYVPFALEGYCPDLSIAQIPTSTYYARIALFHSLLSSAAFHLRNATSGSKMFHKLGLQHRAKSLQALNAALIHPNDSHLYTVYLTAMLSLVTIDTMTEEDSDFRIHLEGCRQLQKSPYFSSVRNGSTQQLDSICHFLTLLARTTSHELQPRAWRTDGPQFDLPYFHSDERSMEYIYGITPTLGNLLEKTCQIAEYLAFYKRGDIPPDLLEARETLRNELSWVVESESFLSIELEQSTTLEIVRCQACAFHSALLIFYYRTVEVYSLVNLEDEVQAVWENLTNAENIKDDFMGGEKRTAPMSWPAFIAACEATDRQPWVEWWVRVQDYRVGNFVRQWRIIQEIWDIMDTDEKVTNWRDALKRLGKLILPI